MEEARPVGELFREWRHRRRLSQLDLAIQADVSPRHVSFVETGRTIPSRKMVLHLAAHLQVPVRERNRLLVAAGHAPIYRQRPFDDPDLAVAVGAMKQVLIGHEPFPALITDRRWTVLQGNAATEILVDGADPALLEPPVNVLRIALHPKGMAPRLLNLEEVRAFLLPRLAHQVQETGDPELSDLYAEVSGYGPAVEPEAPSPAEITMPIRLRYRDTELSFFTTITTFGAAWDITLAEIALESYFPADDHTRRFMTGRGGPSRQPPDR
jgi:transcriptional regulator with XRE-family HTH domain